jgi:ubiquinone/menaquinone biosynthesis C-methylase UbiE
MISKKEEKNRDKKMENDLMEEKIYSPEYVKNLFNKMSNSNERMNYITSFGFSIRWRRQFLGTLKPTNDKIEIIDLMT